MVQVKVFDEEHEDDLSEVLNAFLAEKAQSEIVDIQFSTAACMHEGEQIYCFSAMVVYVDSLYTFSLFYFLPSKS